jgi:hypothetical protein
MNFVDCEERKIGDRTVKLICSQELWELLGDILPILEWLGQPGQWVLRRKKSSIMVSFAFDKRL